VISSIRKQFENTSKNKVKKMRNYVNEWVNGSDTNPQKEQASARIDIEISARIDEIADIFGVKRSAVIEASLDMGTRQILHDINYKHPLEPMSKDERLDLNMAKEEYEEGKRAFEESKGDK
jgi:hypothetical protein